MSVELGVGSDERFSDESAEGRRPWIQLLLLLAGNPRARLGAAAVLVFIVVGVFAPWLSPYDPTEMHLEVTLEAPSALHWFGTDELGRDVLSRTIYGARISLFVGIVAVSIALGVGAPLGMMAGFFGAWLDEVLVRVTDIVLAFPPVLLAIFLAGISEPSVMNVIVPITVVYIPVFVRLARGEVLVARELEFVTAARAMGAGSVRLLAYHIMPNTMAPIMVQATLAVAISILTESTLSFLGLGPQPPTATWGGLLSDGRAYMTSAPWLTIFPGLAIVLAVTGINLLGDALRDTLDPKLRGMMHA